MIDNIEIVAHRGGIYIDSDENTIKSIVRSIENGIKKIEIDLQLLIDGSIIVFHDDNSKRITTLDYDVSNLNREKWSQMRTIKNNPLPFFSEILILSDNHDDVVFILDLKTDGMIDRVLSSILERKSQLDRFIIVSEFRSNLLGKMIEIGYIVDTYESFDDIIKNPIISDYIFLDYRLLVSEPYYTYDLTRYGYRIYVYTINNTEDLKIIDINNIEGIISDYPLRFF